MTVGIYLYAIHQVFFLLQLEIKQKNEEKKAFRMKIAEMEVRVELMTDFQAIGITNFELNCIVGKE